MNQSSTSSLIESTLRGINNLKALGFVCRATLVLLRSLLLVLSIIGISNYIYPTGWLVSLTASLLIFIILLYLGYEAKPKTISLEQFSKTLELKFPYTNHSPLYSSNETNRLNQEWKGILSQVKSDIKTAEKKRVIHTFSTMFWPTCLYILSFSSSTNLILLNASRFANSISNQTEHYTLEVEQGLKNKSDKKIYHLSTKTPSQIELLSTNFVSITATPDSTHSKPSIILTDMNDTNSVYQSFQMLPENFDEEQRIKTYKVSFAIDKSSQILAPDISPNKAIAKVTVKTLPIPTVQLKQLSPEKDPWNDDTPINLEIKAQAHTPIQMVSLLIYVGKKESRELVHKIQFEKKLSYQQNYNLLLEPYINSDIAQVEIVAEVLDSTLPSPLLGYSKPISLTTASAYGRYQRTLQSLRAFKSEVDQAVSEQSSELSEEAKELILKSKEQAEDTPFFDGIDRMNIFSFLNSSKNLDKNNANKQLLDLSQQLNNFLIEHEILDDRERDRDFFVAARAMSRLLDQEKTKRPIPLQTASDHMISFLEERRNKWQKRVSKLNSKTSLNFWPTLLEKKPFITAFQKISDLDKKQAHDSHAQSMQLLSQTVASYRSWIDELEKAEDKQRQELEKKRQKGLASAQKKLKELQKRQGKVSKLLDKARNKAKKKLNDDWPIARLKQNTNLEESRQLEAAIRALAPQASNRLKAALQTMDATLEAGNSMNFVQAETYSDLAGRLLRQAEKDSRKRKNRGNRRTRRRVTGDHYYGQSIHGGDLEINREYQVDKKYREDILNEVQGAHTNKDGQLLLKDYLRRVVR